MSAVDMYMWSLAHPKKKYGWKETDSVLYNNMSGQEIDQFCFNSMSNEADVKKCKAALSSCGGKRSCERDAQEYLEMVKTGYTGSFTQYQKEKSEKSASSWAQTITTGLETIQGFFGIAPKDQGTSKDDPTAPKNVGAGSPPDTLTGGGMSMATKIAIGVGVVAVIGIGIYFMTKKKD